MRIIGFTEVVYGADYLYWAIRSAAPYVDAYYVAWAAEPGRNNPYVNPDSEAVLHEAAERACREAGIPLVWYGKPRWPNRYAQRNSIFEQVPDADVIILTDADEVWQGDTVAQLAKAAYDGTTRFTRVPFLHFWRSFGYAMADHSETLPLRAYTTRHAGQRGEPFTTLYDLPPVLHFGYARTPASFWYKVPSHGHINTPTGRRWFFEQWLNWAPGDARPDPHPYDSGRFGPVTPYDPAWLPTLLADHPYAGLDRIGGDLPPTLLRKDGALEAAA